MKILIINGPNINMLGIREPSIYGGDTYASLCQYIKARADELNIEVQFFQSNSEGDIVTQIQKAYNSFDGIIINPAAYTHTSIAILDALKAVGVLAAEVHISDIARREAFRQLSYAGMACKHHFIGLGKDGYIKALEALYNDLKERKG